MEELGEVLLVTAAAGIGGTGLGGAAACLLRRDCSKMVSFLLSFAAGVMLGVVCFDLLADALQVGLLRVAAGVLAGYGITALLNACITQQNCRPRQDLLLAGVVTAAAIAVHNMPEGMAIGTSFAQTTGNRQSGMVMATVIGLHNIPEGMAVAVPLVSGGMSRKKAAAVSAAAGAPSVAGALLGYFMGNMGPGMLALSLSFAAGAMLYVVFGELLPEAQQLWHSHLPALAAVVGMMTGMVIVYA